jgi:2'-5' RNA ligase
MRLFTAFELPSDVRAEVIRLQASLRELPFRRWQSPLTLHLTLHFFGAVETTLLAPLEERLRNACSDAAPFRLELGGLGAFPSLKHPRTLWLGLEGELERLVALETTLHPLVTALGIPLDARPYRPHVTLARDPLGPVAIADHRPRTLGWQASELVLFHSTQLRTGAVHEAIARFPLSGPHPRRAR